MYCIVGWYLKLTTTESIGFVMAIDRIAESFSCFSNFVYILLVVSNCFFISSKYYIWRKEVSLSTAPINIFPYISSKLISGSFTYGGIDVNHLSHSFSNGSQCELSLPSSNFVTSNCYSDGESTIIIITDTHTHAHTHTSQRLLYSSSSGANLTQVPIVWKEAVFLLWMPIWSLGRMLSKQTKKGITNLPLPVYSCDLYSTEFHKNKSHIYVWQSVHWTSWLVM